MSELTSSRAIRKNSTVEHEMLLTVPMVQLRFGTACERTNSKHVLPLKAGSLIGTMIG